MATARGPTGVTDEQFWPIVGGMTLYGVLVILAGVVGAPLMAGALDLALAATATAGAATVGYRHGLDSATPAVAAGLLVLAATADAYAFFAAEPLVGDGLAEVLLALGAMASVGVIDRSEADEED